MSTSNQNMSNLAKGIMSAIEANLETITTQTEQVEKARIKAEEEYKRVRNLNGAKYTLPIWRKFTTQAINELRRKTNT